MKKFIIMGVQGCGKGTQARMLAESYDLVHISVGDIFRWNIQARTKLAARIARVMNEGALVPDEIVDEIVRRRLDEHDWNYGFILDGFPRNRGQAEFFLESYDVDAVLLIDVPDRIVLERIVARRLCGGCRLDYNLIFHRPAREGVCDVCGGSLIQRGDDNEAAVRARIREYREKTQPIVDFFRRKASVIVADGTGTPDEIQADLRRQLKLA